MADTFDAGAYTFGSDEIGGVQFERIKIILGGDGTNAGDMASGAGAVGATVPRVTLASDDPAVVDLAAIEVLLTGIDSDTDAIKTAVQLIDNAISGTEMQVDVVASLPAGTNAIGKLAANSGVDIGDVDVTSVVPGTGATSLGKAEDAAHSTGDVGVMALAVRTDTAAARAGSDADYAPLEVDAIGRLHANATQISDAVYDGTTLCTVKRFHVVTSTNGADLIAAVASKKFRILSFAIFSISGTITRFWLEDSDGTDIFGSSTGLPLEEDSGAAPPGFILNHNPHGWFQSPTANKDLHIGLTAAQTVVVIGTYIEVA